MTYLLNKDPKVETILGKRPGRRYMTAFGEREGMGTTVTGEDIWRGNDLSATPSLPDSDTNIPTPAAAGEQMTFISESNADNGATATGVLTLRMEYLDDTGAEQTEDITMNGTTGVNTTATNIRFINDIYTLTVGTNGVAEGNIRVYKTGSAGLVYNMIAVGGNKSIVPHRMVPLGKKLVVTDWNAAEAQGKRIAFRIRSTDMSGVLIPGVFCFKDVLYLNKSVGRGKPNFVAPALSIVKVSGWPDAASAEGSCSWTGELVDD